MSGLDQDAATISPEFNNTAYSPPLTQNSSNLFTTLLPWLMCSIPALFYCYAYFLRVSPSVMLGDLAHHFQITQNSATLLSYLSVCYYLGYTPMQPVVGAIIDRYGLRFVLALSCLFSALGVFFFINADSLWLAAAGRFMIGFGTAFAYISTLKMATLWLPPNRFATMAGATTAFGMIAASFSEIYLGKFVESVGYRGALYSSVIVGIIFSVVIFILVRDCPKEKTEEYNNTPKPSFADIGRGIAKISKNPQMWLIGIIGALLYLPASVILDLWGVAYLKAAYHLTAEKAGFLITMIFIGWIISAPIIGTISDKIQRRRKPLVIASFLAAVVLSCIFYVPHIPTTALYFLFFIFGACCGSHPLCFSLSLENNSKQLSGTAIATTNCLIMLGGVIFQPLVGKLLDLIHNGPVANGMGYSTSDYTLALTVVPVALVVAIVLSLFVKETYCKVPK